MYKDNKSIILRYGIILFLVLICYYAGSNVFLSLDEYYDNIMWQPIVIRVVYLPIYTIANLLSINNELVLKILFTLPVILADIVIYNMLNKLYSNKTKEINMFYVFSPVLIYAAFLNFSYDLVAIAILFGALYLLKQVKYTWAAIVLAIAAAAKNPAILSLPLLMMYVYKNNKINKYEQALRFVLVFSATYIALTLPFVISGEYVQNVLVSNSVDLIMQSHFKIGARVLYLTPIILLLIYTRFSVCRKINRALLFDFIGLVYLVFVMLMEPEPNWYLWSSLFITVMFIEKYEKNKKMSYIFWLFSAIYLVYFTGIYEVLTFNLIPKEFVQDILFSALEFTLLVICYVLYRFGIAGNKLYSNNNSSIMIGVGGDSGAGKSTLINSIKEILGASKITEIEADGDHKWERGDEHWSSFTHLDPKANYLHRQADYLKNLKQGEVIRRVEYEHDTGKFSEPYAVKPNDYILLAGLHPFYLPKTRRLVDIKIYLDTDENLRRHWKILRDTTKRGHSKEKVLEQIENRMPDAEKYIYTQKQFSNFVVRYYTDDEFEVGSPEAVFNIKLLLKFSVDIDVDDVVETLYLNNIDVEHGFDEDLKYQTLVLSEPVPIEIIKEIVSKKIDNLEQFVDENKLKWLDGFNSFIQMMLLINIVKIKSEEE